MTRDEERQIEHDCQRTLTRAINALDAHDGDAVTEMMTDDVWWTTFQGDDFKGRDAVRKFVQNRPATATLMHVLSNFVATVKDSDNASSVCYLAVLLHEGEEEPKGSVQVSLPVHNLIYYDEYRRTDQGWRIFRQHSKPVFHG